MSRALLLLVLAGLCAGSLGCAEAVPAADGGDSSGVDVEADLPDETDEIAADLPEDGDLEDLGASDGSEDGDALADLLDASSDAGADGASGDLAFDVDAADVDALADAADDGAGSDPDVVDEPDTATDTLVWDLGEQPDMFSRTCGNFTVEGVEQCDDGNFVNLDGCDSRCRYEHLYRLTRLALQPGAAPSWCDGANRLGRAFGTTTGPLNDTIASQITSNAMLLGLWLLDANVPPVQPDPELSVGVVGLTTDTRSPVTASTRDAWFRVPAMWLFGSGPAYRFSPGRLRDELLRAGPANVTMPFLGTTLNLRAALLRARFGAESSTPNEPPLRIAEGLTTPNELLGSDAEVGLCGEVTVASLARVPIPTFFTSGPGACSDSCAGSRAYVACPSGSVTASCNSMLDLLVSGCAAGGACAFPLVDAIQPDRGAGGGVPRVLVADEETGKVTVAEPNDAYSAYFHFTGLRAHITNNLPD